MHMLEFMHQFELSKSFMQWHTEVIQLATNLPHNFIKHNMFFIIHNYRSIEQFSLQERSVEYTVEIKNKSPYTYMVRQPTMSVRTVYCISNYIDPSLGNCSMQSWLQVVGQPWLLWSCSLIFQSTFR